MPEKYRYLPRYNTLKDPSSEAGVSLAKLLETASAESLRNVIKDLIYETPQLERLSVTLLLAHNKTRDEHSMKAATNPKQPTMAHDTALLLEYGFNCSI